MLRLAILAVALTASVAVEAAEKPKANLCLATNIYFEARNQPWKGQLAVKDVTLNRGGSVCATVFKRKQFSWTDSKPWRTVVQFLLDAPKDLNKLEQRAWERAKAAAKSKEVVLPKTYTHFHTLYVSPSWTGPGVVIGSHKFLEVK